MLAASVLTLTLFLACQHNDHLTNKASMNIPTVTSDAERLAPGKIDSLTRKALITQTGNSTQEEQKQSQGYILRISYADSYFKVIKNFYPSGMIRNKGVIFNSGGFMTGTWYYFNDNGTPARKENTDSLYKFTFEDLHKLLTKRNIGLSIGYIPPLSGFHTTIEKKTERNRSVWVVVWQKEPQMMEELIIDGTTGAVLSTTDKRIKEG